MTESPLLPNLITSRQLKQFCVFYFSAPLKRQHLDNFNYRFNSVKCMKKASLGLAMALFPTVFLISQLQCSVYFLSMLGEVTTPLRLPVLPKSVGIKTLKEDHP